MPPEGESPRPSPAEIALLRQWVEANAPDFGPAVPERKFISPDDLHRFCTVPNWKGLDDATRRVLHQVAARLPQTPLLVVGTGRDDGENLPALTLFEADMGAALDTRIALGPNNSVSDAATPSSQGRVRQNATYVSTA